MKRLFYPPPIREFLMVVLLLLVGNSSVFGEGSKDFWDYPGFRLFYLIADASPTLTNEQQLKVYAAEGEYINVGSSHVGIAEGFINVFRPDGSLHSTFDGIGGTAIINNDVEELAGPTGAGTTNGAGYTPGVIAVESGQAGIWTVVLDYPVALQNSSSFLNLSNGEVWTREVNQPTNGRVALAWDVTVSQNAAGNMGGNLLEGRVYSNEYISIVSNPSPDVVVNATSPTFFVLTRSGFQYQIDFDRADPWGFPLFSNSMGIVNGDRKATFQSLDRNDYTRSADPSSWTTATNYLYHPQAEDIGLLWNNKIFFNIPDSNMPAQATVTDVLNGNNTHATWLFTPVADENVGENSFGFSGDNPAGGVEVAKMQVGEGGNFIYASQVGGIGQLQLDLNNNGSYTDPVDRVITAEAVLGDNNTIFWDGLDGEGNAIPANPNFQFNYDLTVRGGEVHILMDDVENNLGGVTFTRINGVNSPAMEFFYDHSRVGGGLSGGGTNTALATTTPFTYENNFGDTRLLDYWSFVEASNFGAGAIEIAIVQDFNAAEAAQVDTDGDGVDDEFDLDDDNDGILDSIEMAESSPSGDSDNDGVLDWFDLDSDNDGIKDVIESDNLDPDGDGRIGDGAVIVNADGIVISDAAGNTIVYNPERIDPDGPGTPDYLDIDSDNNGIFDVVEAGLPDPDNDGRLGMSPVMVNVDGCVIIPAGPDNDGDGIEDDIDLDDDNDGIPDAIEIASASANGDTDGDGILDQFDLDSDNDGISDLIEAGHNRTDANGDGIIDGAPADFGANGLFNQIATSADGLDANINYTRTDWDGDGVPDHLDLDSDNDGIYDVVEVSLGASDTNNDGRLDTAVDANGIATIVNPVDTDGDGVGDWHDWDTDNDGIHDVVENLNPDADSDGIIGNGTPTVDAAGVVITDGTGAGIIYNPNTVNTDGTGAADFRDLDSDGDGILDVAEAGLPDGDGNGILGTGTPSISPFGVPSAPDANGNTVTSISNPRDTDGDGSPDFQDVGVDCSAANTPVLGPISNGELCAGASAVVSVSGATNFVGPVNFTWTGPNGFTETGRLENVNSVYQITVQDAGTYSLSVTTDEGCTSAAVSTVVNAITGPTAVIGGTSGAICSTDNVNLTATDLGAGTTYEWFRDGVSLGSTDVPAFNAGSAAGSYTVIATQNACPGAPSAASIVTIMAPPTVGIGGSVGMVCSGDAIQLTATPLAVGTIYSWFLDGVLITTTTDPSFSIPGASAANNGNYAVSATLNGCVGPLSSAAAITVGAGPNVAIGGTNGDICSDTNIELTASDVGANASYEWFQNGASIATTDVPSLPLGPATVANSGSYTVVATQNGCVGDVSSASTINVSESTSLTPMITVDNAFLCEGDDFLITSSGVTGTATYIWFLNGVEFTRTDVPMITVEGVTIANTGEYSLEVMQGVCTSIAPSAVSLEVGGAFITTTLSAGESSICAGESTTLTATDAGEGYSYEWFLNGVLVTTTSDPSVTIDNATAANAGEYTVIPVRATCSGTVSNAVTIAVMDAPSAGVVTIGTETVAAGEEATVCPGENVTLVVDGAGTATLYDWFQNGALVATTEVPTLTLDGVMAANGGNYTVIPSNGSCSGAESAIGVLNINEAGAVPTIASDVSNVCPGEMVTLTATGGAAGATYEWFNGTTSLATTTEPMFVATGAGSYTVVTTGSLCGGGTSNVTEVTLNAVPMETAMILDLPSLNCGETTAMIEAVAPAASTGTWTSADPNVVFANPNSPTTSVSGLNAGSILTWTLNDGVCGDFSTDNLTVNIAQGIATATDDAFSIIFNNALNTNIIDNDNVDGQESTVTLISNPTNGTATISGGMLQYTPNTNFAGVDRLEYEICNVTCPGMVCDRAFVDITVDDPNCFVPDAITPNGDGFNDVFTIPCAATNNIGMKIFNRWGDKVFETERYTNNWAGTHDGELLPPGPYYYVLDDGSDEMRSGCVSITR